MKSLSFFSLLLLSLSVWSQDTQINYLDEFNRKQGKWVFYDENRDTALVCMFRNDTVMGERIFYKAGKPEIARTWISADEERFVYFYKGYPVKGWFDRTGDPTFTESRYNSLRDRMAALYSSGNLLSYYGTSKEALNVYIKNSLAKAKGRLAKGKLMIELSITEDGIVEKVKVLTGEVKKETELLKIFYTMGNWQPAFQNWSCVASTVKVPLEF
jgi:hypothetical protein